MEVAEAVLNALFVHGNPLLEYMQGARDDVELGNNFLESQGQLLSRSCYSGAWVASISLVLLVVVYSRHNILLSTHLGLHLTLVHALCGACVRPRRLNFLAARVLSPVVDSSS